eukprot:361200-Chlamydomonas_euryale.AAC.14
MAQNLSKHRINNDLLVTFAHKVTCQDIRRCGLPTRPVVKTALARYALEAVTAHPQAFLPLPIPTFSAPAQSDPTSGESPPPDPGSLWRECVHAAPTACVARTAVGAVLSVIRLRRLLHPAAFPRLDHRQPRDALPSCAAVPSKRSNSHSRKHG